LPTHTFVRVLLMKKPSGWIRPVDPPVRLDVGATLPLAVAGNVKTELLTTSVTTRCDAR
jgi:hypothetical protein